MKLKKRKTLRVLYDHKIFEQQKLGGVSRYFSEIISCISREIETDIAVKYSDNTYLKKKELALVRPIIDYREEFIKGIEFKGKGRLFNLIKFMNKARYPDPYETNLNYTIELLKKQNFDLFHPTTYDPYFLDYIGDKPFVITVHDMIHELYPEFIHKDDHSASWKKKLVERAAHIITVSENTKKDLIEILSVPEDRITVIYHGLPDFKNSSTKLNLGNYFLYVGERHGYKNFLFFIFSIAAILREYNVKLICTGLEFNEIEKRKFRELQIDEYVLHYFADEAEMYTLYSNAIAFIFPSLYEGFGFPIIEAFSCDCPVILSRSSCFQEIAGNAALYFNPKSKSEIFSQVISIIDNSPLRNELVSFGQERRKKYSWVNASSKIIEVYKKIV